MLTLERLSKTYGGTRVLSGVDLALERHAVHALVGGNGSGKSTLIKLLAGVVAADHGGHIVVGDRRVAAGRWSPHAAREAQLRFVHQDLGLFPDLSVADNLCIGSGYQRSAVGRVRWREVAKHARVALRSQGMDVDPGRRLGELSLAEQSMVAIARALQDVHEDASACVVLDEPTAALPPHEAGRLLEVLRALAASGHSIVLVTHHLDEVLAASDRVTVLRDGCRVHSGPTRALDRAALIELIVGRPETSIETPDRPVIDRSAEVLRTADLRTRRAHGISLTVHRGEVVGLTGLLGAGWEDIPRALFGLEPVNGGEVWINGERHESGDTRRDMRAGIAFLPGDRLRDGIFGEMSVLENVTAASTSLAGRWRLHHRRERRSTQALIEQYQVRPPQLRRQMQTLSGGNQQKVLLARWARRKPRLLLLEEPTRGVDVGARTEIWSLLRRHARDEGLSVLVTSSDVEELAWYCDRIIVMGEGRVRGQLEAEDRTPARVTHAIYEASVPTSENSHA